MATIKITQKRNETTEVAISGELTIYCAMDIFQNHLQNLTIKALLDIKLAKVTEIDTAGIQLLIMLINLSQAQNKPYQITSISDPIEHYLKLFNLHHLFNCEPSINANEQEQA